ncbi:MAG: MG2 domain-containing protein [bacterium]|nr:MG2 domain-containing protein [bacterium]
MSRIAWFVMLWGLALITGLAVLAIEPPSGTITGHIRDTEGHPLAGARIRLNSGNVVREAVSALDGTYRIEGIPAGEWYGSCRARGHESQWLNTSVEVLESRTLRDVDFSLAERSPALGLRHHTRTFLPGSPVRLEVTGALIADMHLVLRRLEGPRWSRLLERASELDRFAFTPGSPAWSPVRDWHLNVRPRPGDEDGFYRTLELARELAPGMYHLAIAGTAEPGMRRPEAPLSDGLWFEVTRLGLVAKVSPERVLVAAFDLLAHRLVPGLPLTVTGQNPAPPAFATGPDGLATWPVAPGAPILLAAVMDGSPAHVTVNPPRPAERHQLFLTTDRPLYRPGHPVGWKVTARSPRKDDPGLPAGEAVRVTLVDARDREVERAEGRFDNWGAFHGTFELPATTPLGDHRLVAEWQGTTEALPLSVQAYRKPDFRIELVPEATTLLPARVATCDLALSYLFGGPVPDAPFHYRILARPATPAAWSMWSDEELGFERLVGADTGTTDSGGKARLLIPTEALDRDELWTIEVEATDLARQVVKGQATLTVRRGDLDVACQLDRDILEPGAPLGATVTIRTPEGSGLVHGGEAILEAVESVWLPAEDRWNEQVRVLERRPFRTDAEGRARLDLPTGRTHEGTLQLRIAVHDRGGRLLQERASIWLTSEDWARGAGPARPTRVHLDRERYRPGEKARVLVESPDAGLDLLLVVEGREMYETHVLPAGRSRHVLELPVQAAWGPDVDVVVQGVEGTTLHTASARLRVAEDHDLRIEVLPDRPIVEPGAEVGLTVRTLDPAGRPVPADVSVGVVDEAIYQLAHDPTRDPREVFHGPRGSEILTVWSFAEDYSAGPGKDLAAAAVRHNLRDTAAWLPVVRTDGQGTARVRFTLPENLTTWIVTARGISRDTRAGSVRERFLATRDLVVRLALPRSMTVGDRLDLAGLVHDLSPRPLVARLTSWFQGIRILTAPPASVRLVAGGASRVGFTAEATAAGTASVALAAVSGSARDGLETQFPVYPLGEVTVGPSRAGEVSTGRVWVATCSFPPGTEPGASWLEVQTGTGIRSTVTTLLGELERYPFGCSEQTTSKLVGTVVGRHALGLPAREDLRRELLDRLLAMQHADGGWGWFPGDPSDLEHTAIVCEGLLVAHAHGLRVDPEVFARGIRWWLDHVPGTGPDLPGRHLMRRGAGPDARARLAATLAMSGAVDQLDGSPWLADQVDHLTDAGLAWRMLARPSATRDRETLEMRARHQDHLLAWTRSRRDGLLDGSERETTARVIWALEHVRPGSAVARSAAERLTQACREATWLSTLEQAWAIAALASLVPPEATDASTVSVMVDGRAWTGAHASRPWAGRVGPMGPGEHRIEIRLAGSGSVPVWARSRHLVARNPVPSRPHPDVTMSRRWFRLDRTRLDRALAAGDAPLEVTELPGAGTSSQVHDVLLVELTARCTRDLERVQLSMPLPAGFEVVKVPEGSWSGAQVLDDQVVWFQESLASGSFSVQAWIRPEIAGRIQVRPATLEAMYDPGLHAGTSSEVRDVLP